MNREDHIAMGHRALTLASEQLLFALEHLREAGLNVTCGHIRNAADSVLTALHQVMAGGGVSAEAVYTALSADAELQAVIHMDSQRSSLNQATKE